MAKNTKQMKGSELQKFFGDLKDTTEYYYIATINGKKVRGVLNKSGTWVGLENAEEIGDCQTDALWPYNLDVDIYYLDDSDGHTIYNNYGITDIKIVTDKRLKRLIDMETYPMVAGYTVQKDGNSFKFGCGDVVLTTKQIAGFLEARKLLKSAKFKAYNEVVDQLNSQDIDVEDIEESDIKSITQSLKRK